ncbi:hypothetical protein BDZ89DRAFT_1070213 [Hymenopellis radicata]|nr:hypothetical protein BDZ89DRAFT_1070213 [Hymenopellis radicata]
MSTTSLRRGRSFDFPQELIDEIISHNQDDSVFIRAASLVSKPWRAAALRYLFSQASFLCKADFTRWVTICASLPCVAKYVRQVDLEKRAERAPDGFVGRSINAIPKTISAFSAFSPFRDYSTVLDCDFPADSDFELVLPPMNNVTHLHWTTLDTETGFDVNITHFLGSLTRVRRLSCWGSVGLELEHVMSFFPELRQCEFTCGISEEDVEDKLDFAGNLSKLEEVWFDDCAYGSMDWLSNRIFSKSLPPLRKIGWEFMDPPLSPAGFVRLIQMVASTLEELCFGTIYDETNSHKIIPPFALGAILPVLRTVFIRATEDHKSLFRWLHTLMDV